MPAAFPFPNPSPIGNRNRNPNRHPKGNRNGGPGTGARPGPGPRRRHAPARAARTTLAGLLIAAALLAIALGGPGTTQASSHWTDYDTDNDNLIEIRTLAQLNAIRWDLDGDGEPSGTNTYNNAFPDRKTGTPNRNGCAATCAGYELMADLDFNTGDTSIRTDDAYYNSGAGWEPVAYGTAGFGSSYNTTFEGNGHVISNLYINRTSGETSQNAGLFGYTNTSAAIRNVGIKDATVTLTNWAGILVGDNRGTIQACWTSGTITANTNGGGLVGRNRGTITASYSTASVTGNNFGNNQQSGGLVGHNHSTPSPALSGVISYSYFAGTLSHQYTTNLPNPLVGVSDTGTTITASYWDNTVASGFTDDARGFSTAELQSPTAYGTTGSIYADWDVDLDGTTGGDDPWHFGSSSDYPILKYNRHAYGISAQQPATAGVNYDRDADNLISIANLAQLDAVRYDLDGNGIHSARGDSAFTILQVFPGLAAGTPCAGKPVTGNTGTVGACIGYELANNLDFDTNRSGATHTNGIGDAGDAYHNGGAGWMPIGGHHKTTSAPYTGTFDGNDYTISNLFIKPATATTSDNYHLGLFGRIGSAGVVRNVGLVDPYVNNTRTHLVATSLDGVVTGALAGTNAGTVSGSYASGGSVAASQTYTGPSSQLIVRIHAGCLLGVSAGNVSDSWASCAATAEGAYYRNQYLVGGLIGYLNAANATVSDSFAAGTVTISSTGNQSENSWAGGLVGNAAGHATNGNAQIIRSFATGAVSSNHRGNHGGLAGSASYTTVTNTFATGAVANTAATTAGGNRSEVGGLIGRATASAITSSFATGAVTVGASASSRAGGLVGHCFGNCDLAASFAAGAVAIAGDGVRAGGLVGLLDGGTSSVNSCYATGAVSATGGAGDRLGGLIGEASSSPGPTLFAGYSIGTVTGGTGDTIGGLTSSGSGSFGSVSFSYWDTTSSTITTTTNRAGTGRTTTQLQAPTGYTGIYTGSTLSWNQNLDGMTGNDDPWDFGTASDYPILKYNYDGYGYALQRALLAATPPDPVDYDANNNGLVDVTTLAQLDAIRYDLDGNGVGAHDGDAAIAYAAAFPNMAVRQGCPAYCAGYELANSLDFDTGHYGDRTDDAYYGAGAREGHGWAPIIEEGTETGYSGVFDGNGHTIANLYIDLPAGTTTEVTRIGLFGQLDRGGVIRNVGVTDASVFRAWGTGGIFAGALLGYNYGTVQASYATGAVSVSDPHGSSSWAGGLVGQNNNHAIINASYAVVAASAAETTATSSNAYAGGLVGANFGTVNASYAAGPAHATAVAGSFAIAGGLVGNNPTIGRINASYAVGTATGSGAGTHILGGLAGSNNGPITDSYWNTETSGLAAGAGSGPVTGITGHTTTELLTPTDYTGIYANWNLDLDGDGAGDDPWRFGTDSEFPVLYFSRPDPAADYEDYDADNDGLIEITTLDQLNAVRYDLDGDGNASHPAYHTAFAERDPVAPNVNGCVAACVGYELAANLNFDTDRNGATYTTDPATNTVTGDDGDDYNNDGAGWQPIGGHRYSDADHPRSRPFAATFDGNGHTISNLYINLSTPATDAGSLAGYYVGLFARNVGTIQNVGLVNPYVNNARAGARAVATGTLHVATGALVGSNMARADSGDPALVRGSYVSGGSVTGSQAAVDGSLNIDVGCLAGELRGAGNQNAVTDPATVSRSWASCAATATGADPESHHAVGGLIGHMERSDLSHSRASGAVTAVTAGGPSATRRAGGLVGAMDVRNTVTGSSASGAVSGIIAGGLIGNARLGFTLLESFATGAVTSPGTLAGGLVGSANANNISPTWIRASFATGDVTISGASCLAGGLVGRVTSVPVSASFATGTVTASGASCDLGGLVGRLGGTAGAVHASYATGAVATTDTGGSNNLGGLVGEGLMSSAPTITASYATGAVTSATATTDLNRGLSGDPQSPSFAAVTDSYWDTETSGILDATPATSPGEGKTTAELQTPTEYGAAGEIYPSSTWNRDIDGDGTADNPWRFGTASQYPILQYRQDAFGLAVQLAPVAARDYDGDDDNLITVSTLAQLDAIRHDLDGNGASARTPAAAAAYAAAFPGLTVDMGCAGICRGYELDASLDFDTDGDGAADAPYANWTPIGAAATPYTAAFHGNGHTLSNLTITASSAGSVGLFGAVSGANARIDALGLPNVSITLTYADETPRRIGAIAGNLARVRDPVGVVSASYATGEIAVTTGSNSDASFYVGGLVGLTDSGSTIVASYSGVNVTVTDPAPNPNAPTSDTVGGLAGVANGAVANSYARGTLASNRTGAEIGGLIGVGFNATVTASYWDSDASGVADDADDDPPEGKRTAELQRPTRYTGIYAAWNQADLDGDGEDDAPWDFGDACQYPVLDFAGHTPAAQRANDPVCPAAGEQEYVAPPIVYNLNIRFSVRRISLDEGQSASYRVRLSEPPAGHAYNIAIRSDNPDVIPTPDRLTFSSRNWNQWQTVKITVARDQNDTDENATISHRGPNLSYGSIHVAVADTWPGAAEETVNGHTVTMRHELDAPPGVTVTVPDTLDKDTDITIGGAPADAPDGAPGYGIGREAAARMLASIRVRGAPADGLDICLPLPAALVDEAGERPLALLRYADALWAPVADAERRASPDGVGAGLLCADGVMEYGIFAPAYALPALGRVGSLAAAPGDAPGSLVLTWTPGVNAAVHWIAGVKQTDPYTLAIWGPSESPGGHTFTDLEPGAPYIVTVTAGRGESDGSQWTAWAPWAYGTAAGAASTAEPGAE